jgi:uncharacterized membrane protein
MNTKPWYLSKTVWAGIITALVGAAQTIGLQFGVNILDNHVVSIVLTVLGVLGVYGRVSSTTTIK